MTIENKSDSESFSDLVENESRVENPESFGEWEKIKKNKGLEMKLENQVCTLEQAKEFDELGLKLVSYFVWAQTGIYKTSDTYVLISRDKSVNLGYFYKNTMPAYSCAELEVLLPQRITIDVSYRVNLVISKDYEDVLAEYENPVDYSSEIAGDPGKGAHVKADLLIQCLKAKLINLKDLSLD